MGCNRKILLACNMVPKKRLGQVFLESDYICKKTLTYIRFKKKNVVLEIGPGLGFLTIPVARLVKKLFVIEKDKKLVKILKKKLINIGIKNINVIIDNVLKVDFDKIYNTIESNFILIGNLPYNISSQILFKIIDSKNFFSKVFFMLQKDFVSRIMSVPISREYGRVSVLFQYYASASVIFDVCARMFFPIPKIRTNIIEIKFKKKTLCVAKDERLFSLIVKTAFSKRRKIIKNSLSGNIFNIDDNRSVEILNNARINSMRRAETLSVEEFVMLSNYVYELYANDFIIKKKYNDR